MGHHKLRLDNECQNCGYTVDVAYCSKCGQQNIETRQSFHHLLTHFAEDLTHYDGAFWKTIKYLLFRPGRLTIEYLLGHRMRFVPPVKLYIFISFVTFFLMALMATENTAESHTSSQNTNSPFTISVNNKTTNKEIIVRDKIIYNTHQLDSLQNSLPENDKIDIAEYYSDMIALKARQKDLSTRDLIIGAAHTFPKVLFIYMPIFSFWLWLIHGKKRWYFFDHGIFTLHYFSFLLLLVTINMLIRWSVSFINIDIGNTISSLIAIAVAIYSFFYFFIAHKRFYGESSTISTLKSLVLFCINFVFIVVITAGVFAYILLNMH